MRGHLDTPQPGRSDEHRRRYPLATREDYDNYLAWRTDSGYTARFDEMLAEPMNIRYFDEVRAW
jgi:hypothetical protein